MDGLRPGDVVLNTFAYHLTPAAHELDESLNLIGCTVVPGFVDPHTHVVFAGDRRQELQQRLAGAAYADVAARGGGILHTVAATRAASDDQLVELARPRLDEMLACGTTTCEAKSGYGLTTDSELKLLRVIRALDREHAIDIVPTFMGAHDVPPEFRDLAKAVRRSDYVQLVVDEMIPRVAEEGLATYCDVFCDEGAFTPEEATAILAAGRRHGLRPRVHAEELAPSGGAMVAARAGARVLWRCHVGVDEHATVARSALVRALVAEKVERDLGIKVGGRVRSQRCVRQSDLDIGILWVFAVASLSVYGILLAGWSSSNHFSFLGGLRSSAQIISYELGLTLSVVGVLLFTGSLRLREVVEAQGSWRWNFWLQPVGCLIFPSSAESMSM